MLVIVTHSLRFHEPWNMSPRAGLWRQNPLRDSRLRLTSSDATTRVNGDWNLKRSLESFARKMQVAGNLMAGVPVQNWDGRITKGTSSRKGGCHERTGRGPEQLSAQEKERPTTPTREFWSWRKEGRNHYKLSCVKRLLQTQWRELFPGKGKSELMTKFPRGKLKSWKQKAQSSKVKEATDHKTRLLIKEKQPQLNRT
jgi:hypothetical protein